MKGQAYVKLVGEDDASYVDISTFGVTLIRGWREALLTPPPIKSLITNDSRLSDGISVLARSENIKLDKRDLSLQFYLEGKDTSDYLSKYELFLSKIAYSGQFCLKVPCLGKVYKLVYSQCSKFGDYGLKKGNFTLKLTEYNPNDREII